MRKPKQLRVMMARTVAVALLGWQAKSRSGATTISPILLGHTASTVLMGCMVLLLLLLGRRRALRHTHASITLKQRRTTTTASTTGIVIASVIVTIVAAVVTTTSLASTEAITSRSFGSLLVHETLIFAIAATADDTRVYTHLHEIGRQG